MNKSILLPLFFLISSISLTFSQDTTITYPAGPLATFFDGDLIEADYYILKPFKDEEIHNALKKYQNLKKQLQEPNQPTRFQTSNQIQRNFLTKYRGKTFIIKSEEVALFFISHDVVYLMTHKGEKYPLYKSLDFIESVCDRNNFYRINRQMIVHRNAVVSFQDYFNRKIVLELSVNTEDNPIVSRLKVSEFKTWLMK